MASIFRYIFQLVSRAHVNYFRIIRYSRFLLSSFIFPHCRVPFDWTLSKMGHDSIAYLADGKVSAAGGRENKMKIMHAHQTKATEFATKMLCTSSAHKIFKEKWKRWKRNSVTWILCWPLCFDSIFFSLTRKRKKCLLGKLDAVASLICPWTNKYLHVTICRQQSFLFLFFLLLIWCFLLQFISPEMKKGFKPIQSSQRQIQ